MLYVGFNSEGVIHKITNEPDNSLQYLEISAEMYSKFAESIENIDDYTVVKKDDYVLEKKDKQYSVTSNVFTIPKIHQFKPNSIFIVQNPKNKTFSIKHTFTETFPASQTFKQFFVTNVNNANKLLCTLDCKFEDFFENTYTFDSPYFDDCKIITKPDIQSYYHFVGETVD